MDFNSPLFFKFFLLGSRSPLPRKHQQNQNLSVKSKDRDVGWSQGGFGGNRLETKKEATIWGLGFRV